MERAGTWPSRAGPYFFEEIGERTPRGRRFLPLGTPFLSLIHISLTQIRREAYKWQKAGIDTLEAADAHLHRLSRRNRRGTEILQLLFGESRAPVEKEAEFLDAWIQMGCSDELLLLARDRTIFQLQEFKWTYMNGILTRWYKEGLTTVEAVEASERKNRRPQYPRATPQPAQGTQPLPSDDIGRMIEQARRAAAAKEG